MALPPEPLFAVLPTASTVVIAEVISVTTNDDGTSTGPHTPPSAHQAIASQKVGLKVSRVLKGQAAAEIAVIKPVSAYALRVGNHGPFLLDGASPPAILGRYGPDTYREADIEKQLAGGAS